MSEELLAAAGEANRQSMKLRDESDRMAAEAGALAEAAVSEIPNALDRIQILESAGIHERRRRKLRFQRERFRKLLQPVAELLMKHTPKAP